MDVHADVVVPAPPEQVLAHLDDLDRYPSWMRLVHRVDPVPSADGRPAWFVQLRAKVGPLARSKRLRMERTELVPGRSVVFERVEHDERDHAMWRLHAQVAPEDVPGADHGCRVTVHLHYGGTLWTGGLLERILADEIERGRAALVAAVLSRPTR
jgi:uncharacterized membrane protein